MVAPRGFQLNIGWYGKQQRLLACLLAAALVGCCSPPPLMAGGRGGAACVGPRGGKGFWSRACLLCRPQQCSATKTLDCLC